MCFKQKSKNKQKSLKNYSSSLTTSWYFYVDKRKRWKSFLVNVIMHKWMNEKISREFDIQREVLIYICTKKCSHGGEKKVVYKIKKFKKVVISRSWPWKHFSYSSNLKRWPEFFIQTCCRGIFIKTTSGLWNFIFLIHMSINCWERFWMNHFIFNFTFII